MKIYTNDNYRKSEIDIASNHKDTVFIAFTENGCSLDDHQYYSRTLTYEEAEKLIDCIRKVMYAEVAP